MLALDSRPKTMLGVVALLAALAMGVIYWHGRTKYTRIQHSETVVAIVDEAAHELVCMEVTDLWEGRQRTYRIVVRQTSYARLVEILGPPDAVNFDECDRTHKSFTAQYTVR